MTRLAETMTANPRVVRQFAKFAIVGAIGTVIDVSILAFLHEFIGLNLYVANLFSFSAAVISNYTWNTLWTFGDQEKEHRRQFLQFGLVSIIGLGLSQVLLYFFHDVLGQYYLIAKCLSILIVLFWNFAANRLWTFKE